MSGVSGERDEVLVRDNAAEERYEVMVDGHLARLEYARAGDTLELIHTEVPEELGGRGIAATLARAALEDARAKHLAVVPLCPYVAGYIRKHTEYKDLVPQSYWEQLLKE